MLFFVKNKLDAIGLKISLFAKVHGIHIANVFVKNKLDAIGLKISLFANPK